MPANRQCRRCQAIVPSEDFAQHKASHRAAPPRATNAMRLCYTCRSAGLPYVIRASEYDRHREQHRTRKPIPGWSAIRKQVLARDRCCQKCGATTRLEVHHIVSVNDGGSSHLSNLECRCVACNPRGRINQA
jgi:hypothetical protein